jgi:hypothetical protein
MAKVRLARLYTAMPGKIPEVLAVSKEVAAVVKRIADIDALVFASMGNQIGQFVTVTNYASFADFEEKALKILGSTEYQAIVKKYDGLLVPGSAHEHLLREV